MKKILLFIFVLLINISLYSKDYARGFITANGADYTESEAKKDLKDIKFMLNRNKKSIDSQSTKIIDSLKTYLDEKFDNIQVSSNSDSNSSESLDDIESNNDSETINDENLDANSEEVNEESKEEESKGDKKKDDKKKVGFFKKHWLCILLGSLLLISVIINIVLGLKLKGGSTPKKSSGIIEEDDDDDYDDDDD